MRIQYQIQKHNYAQNCWSQMLMFYNSSITCFNMNIIGHFELFYFLFTQCKSILKKSSGRINKMYGITWYVIRNGTVWYGTVWYGLVRYGTVWYGMVLFSMLSAEVQMNMFMFG